MLTTCDQRRQEVLFNNINSAAPSRDVICSQTLSLQTPRPFCPLFLWSICCWGDTAAGLPSSSLAPVCFTCGCLTQRSRSTLRPCGKRGSVAVAALAIIMLTNSLQLTVGWCWQRDPGLHLKHILSWCGGGNTHKCKTVHWWTIKEAYSSKTVLPLSSVGCRANNVI